jgi:hypothetical protein
MNFKNIRSIYTIALMTFSFAAYSQSDSTKTFTLSGSVDTYVHTSLGAVNNAYSSHGPTTAFANLKGFSLGMVNLIASYQGEKAGFTADVVFGPRGRDAVFYSNPAVGSYTGQRIINQLYAFYKLSDAVTLNMGQFNTFVGYEVISPAVNVNYSTSYLFSNGPFNHTGLRADFSFGDGGVAKLAIMNPTDMLEFNPVNTYTVGAQIGKTSDAGGVWLNLLYGDQDGTLDKDDFTGTLTASAGNLFQADITTGWTLSDAFFLGANASYQTIASGQRYTPAGEVEDIDGDATSFFGVAVYPKLTLSDVFALGLRGEYFSSAKGHPLASPIGLDANGDGNVIAATLSGNYKVGGLIIIPEVRFDKTSEDSYTDKDGDATDTMTTLTLAAVYKF